MELQEFLCLFLYKFNAVIENTQPNGWVFSMVGITGVEPVTLRMWIVRSSQLS